MNKLPKGLLSGIWHILCLITFSLGLVSTNGVWTLPIACWFVSSILSGEIFFMNFFKGED